MPRQDYTAAERAEWQRQRIAQESPRLYGGKTWDGKHWRGPDGKRVKPPPRKPNPFGPDGTLAVRGEVTPSNWVKVSYGNIVQILKWPWF
jgi:hypothetical protein